MCPILSLLRNRIFTTINKPSGTQNISYISSQCKQSYSYHHYASRDSYISVSNPTKNKLHDTPTKQNYALPLHNLFGRCLQVMCFTKLKLCFVVKLQDGQENFGAFWHSNFLWRQRLLACLYALPHMSQKYFSSKKLQLLVLEGCLRRQ